MRTLLSSGESVSDIESESHGEAPYLDHAGRYGVEHFRHQLDSGPKRLFEEGFGPYLDLMPPPAVARVRPAPYTKSTTWTDADRSGMGQISLRCQREQSGGGSSPPLRTAFSKALPASEALSNEAFAGLLHPSGSKERQSYLWPFSSLSASFVCRAARAGSPFCR